MLSEGKLEDRTDSFVPLDNLPSALQRTLLRVWAQKNFFVAVHVDSIDADFVVPLPPPTRPSILCECFALDDAGLALYKRLGLWFFGTVKCCLQSYVVNSSSNFFPS
jgi:hypothetical protein